MDMERLRVRSCEEQDPDLCGSLRRVGGGGGGALAEMEAGRRVASASRTCLRDRRCHG